MILKGKTILLISPQPWSEMYVSKHHYAIELAKRGNKVYFLNPVLNLRDVNILIEQHNNIENIFIITYSSIITYLTKFHARKIYNLFIHAQIKRILRKIGHPIDITWDFDCANLYQTFAVFNSPINIFHPVDKSNALIPPQKKPNIIISVSEKILDLYKNIDTPKVIINHGVNGNFLNLAMSKLKNLSESPYVANTPLEAYYFGNLMIPFIGYESILAVIKEHPNVNFNFCGSFSETGNYKPHCIDFIKKIKKLDNVILHGIKKQSELVELAGKADLFFFYYIENLAYSRDNSHKLLEYLCTGQVVIGNNLSAYKESELYVQANTDKEWVTSFKEIINNINIYNSTERQRKRLEFAIEQSYDNHISKIEEYLNHYNII